VDLDLEITAWGSFTVDGKNLGIGGLDAVRVGFEKVLLWKGSGSAQLEGCFSLTVSDQYWPP
jgi:hypothetical protein